MRTISSSSFLSLLDHAPGIIMITDLDSRVLYVNASVEEHTGYSVREVIGKRPGELWGGHMPRSFYEELWHTIKTKKKPFIATVSNKAKSGGVVSQRLSIAPIWDDDRQMRYFFELHGTELAQIFSSQWFFSTFSEEIPDRIKISRFCEWLSLKDTTYSKQERGWITFLDEQLLKPTYERFAYRTDDHDLVLRAQQDASTFAFLYEKYYRDVFVYLRSHLRDNTHHAYDLTQETFTRAFQYLKHFTPSNASYLTYLRRIAHHLLVDYVREQKTARLDIISEYVGVDLEENMSDVLEATQVLTTLSSIERQVLILMYYQELPLRDIGLHLNKTENAVKLIASRARKKVRSMREE